MSGIGQLIFIYLLGLLTLPLLLAAAVLGLALWAMVPDPEKSNRQTSLLDAKAAALREPSGDNIASPTSPYGTRRTGWLRISRCASGASPAHGPSESAARLSDLVARGINKWIHNKRGKPEDPPPVATNMNYAVLENGTLAMYESEKMAEGHGVIVLSHYQVTLHHSEGASESQMYSRRTPIRLAPLAAAVGADVRQRKDYYLFADRAVDKEDWYYALLWNSLMDIEDGEGEAEEQPALRKQDVTRTEPSEDHVPESTGQEIDGAEAVMRRSCMEPDMSGIHSILGNVAARNGTGVRSDEWLNAIFGRIFIGLYRTEWAREHFTKKLQSKFQRIQRPAFLDEIIVSDLEIGGNVPVITNTKLESFDKDGQVDVSMFVHYLGGFRMVLTTGVKIGSIRMSIALRVVLESLAGKMLLRFRPAPSNRFWLGFYEMPQLRLSLEPVFMQKQVRYNRISQAIEKQIYDILQLSMVLPNMDDTAFFPNGAEGGIFEDAMKEFHDLGLETDRPEEMMLDESPSLENMAAPPIHQHDSVLSEEEEEDGFVSKADNSELKKRASYASLQAASTLAGDEGLVGSKELPMTSTHQRTRSTADASKSDLRRSPPTISIPKAASIKSHHLQADEPGERQTMRRGLGTAVRRIGYELPLSSAAASLTTESKSGLRFPNMEVDGMRRRANNAAEQVELPIRRRYSKSQADH
ncbi:hypothetical protein DL89DRAFT_268682 [Linderina pennispora]|uniref:SMP-LTD domain-containing protein n=1 Tax=Linderina pennispora TaxID=61395 RepID=A0A1Y1W4P2_9FUNG|nr:uncharacterized protein DL89DRAFT_268682 [Linderina pennispora]ORX68144.1 hypothetical protein DL89DRAFT_268682 [Linderina pennispora]